MMALPMENESKAPAPEQEPHVPQRLHVHLLLGLVFIPFFSVLVGWALAPIDVLRGYRNRAELTWTRWLVALVLVDALVAGCMGWVLAHPERLQQPPKTGPTLRIGISFDPGTAKILEVVPDSPAERAGLRPGDVIMAVDGAAMGTSEDVRKAIASGAEGQPRTLTLRRGEESVTATVVPESPVRKKRGLFEAQPSSSSTNAGDLLAGALAFLPAAVVAVVVWLVGRRRLHRPVVVWRGFLLAAVGSLVASVGSVLVLKQLLGGTSLGLVLIGLNVQMATLLGLTALATRWCGGEVPPPVDPPPRLHPVRAALLGIYYLVTGFPRVTILLFTADQILLGGATSAETQALEVLATSPLGVLGTCLFVFVVVFLGPLAEEKLFRGFLVPRLAAQWGSGPAMAISALIFGLFHPHYGLFMPIVMLYGYIFAWARLRTGGIGVPFVLHVMVNGLVSIILLTR
jgi:membrane protease YdiL (CAAX protease family)